MIKDLFLRILSVFLPKVSSRIGRNKEREVKELATTLFSKRNLSALFPYSAVTTDEYKEKMSVRVIHSSEACRIFFLLPDKRNISVRKTDCRSITSAPINKHSSLVLTEYMYPHLTRWSLSGKEEVCCARAEIRHRKQAVEIARFYMPKTIQPKSTGGISRRV